MLEQLRTVARKPAPPDEFKTDGRGVGQLKDIIDFYMATFQPVDVNGVMYSPYVTGLTWKWWEGKQGCIHRNPHRGHTLLTSKQIASAYLEALHPVPEVRDAMTYIVSFRLVQQDLPTHALPYLVLSGLESR